MEIARSLLNVFLLESIGNVFLRSCGIDCGSIWGIFCAHGSLMSSSRNKLSCPSGKMFAYFAFPSGPSGKTFAIPQKDKTTTDIFCT